MPPAQPPKYIELRFPPKGLDFSDAVNAQAPGTTPVGTNVRLFEPLTDRGRGGMRPGYKQYIPGLVPTGAHEIQELNCIIVCDATAFPGSYPSNPNTYPDPPGFVFDPSSPGLPSDWGTRPMNPGDGGPTVTGVSLGTRVPGGADGTPRRVRNGGSASYPPKNTLTEARSTALGFCFQGLLEMTIAHPQPDPEHWDGQSVTFLGTKCAPLFAAPTTAAAFQINSPFTLPGGAGDIPAGTMLIDLCGLYLTLVVNRSFPGGTGTISKDKYSDPGNPCTGGGACTQGGPQPTKNGTAVGAAVAPR